MTSDGGKVRNRGRFKEPTSDRLSVAEQQNPAPKAPNSLARKSIGKLPVRTSLVFGFGLVAFLACVGIGWPVVKSMAGDLAELIFGAVFIAVVIAVHGFASWWCVKTRPGIAPVLIVQAPFPVVYVQTWIWYKVGFSASDGGPPSLWYLPWTAAGLIVLSWLLVGRLYIAGSGDSAVEEPSSRGETANITVGNKKRLLTIAIAVWVMANGAGFAVDRWKVSNGFGLAGFPDPKSAFSAFTASSCLFDLDWYTLGGKSVKADCDPPGRGKGQRPSSQFESTVSGAQPQTALQRWWDIMRTFKQVQPLEQTGQAAWTENGDQAEVKLTVSSQHWPMSGDRSGFHCFPQGRKETWTVQLETVAVGGWKVTRVTVDRAVTVVPHVGSVCERAA